MRERTSSGASHGQWRRPFAARRALAGFGRVHSRQTSEETPMLEPRLWPYDDLGTWRLWRDHLAHLHAPNVATLKREADAELARIARCLEGRWEPKQPALVPARERGMRGPLYPLTRVHARLVT